MTLVSKNGRPSRVTSLFCCQGVVPTWRIRLCWCVLRSSLPLSSLFFVLLFFWVASCGGSGGNVAHNGASSALIANAWIPSGFLANYTFNSAVGVGECYATPSLTPTDASATSTGLTTTSMCGESTSSHQCLYLRGEAAAECVCSCPAERSRNHVLQKMRLSFCTHHALNTVLNLTMVANESPDECLTHLRAVQHYDDLASRVSCEFEHILSRYDCNNGYSSKWNCDDCKAAYKNWVCAMFIPFQRDDVKYHPCRDFCSLVEQQCPYFLPDTKLQYAGESTFICTDPDIEEDIESMSEPPPHAELPHCYLPCHLGLGRRVIDEDKRCHRLIPVPSSREIVTVTTTLKTYVNTTSRGVPIVQEILVVLILTLLLGLIGRTLQLPPFSMGLT